MSRASLKSAPAPKFGALVGYQLARADGSNCQGDDDDPLALCSWMVLSPELATWCMQHKSMPRGFLLMPIYAGDVEESEFLTLEHTGIMFRVGQR